MAVKFVKTELSKDMKGFVDSVCESLISQRASVTSFREAAHDVAMRFLPTVATASSVNKMEKSVLEYMIEEGYVSREVLKAGYIDDNGIEVTSPNEPLPKELADHRYGCRIDYKESNNVEEAVEILLDTGFIRINAFKLRSEGKLYPNKSDFFAHADKDCKQWAQEALEDYPEFRVGKAFNIVWDLYYNIEVETLNSEKLLNYHKLK